MLTELQTHFLVAVLVVLCILLLCIFVRVVKGPRIADRIMGINMMGTVVIGMLSIVAVIQQESYLMDICIIYAVISFLAVVVLAKVYMGVYKEQQSKHEETKDTGKRKNIIKPMLTEMDTKEQYTKEAVNHE